MIFSNPEKKNNVTATMIAWPRSGLVVFSVSFAIKFRLACNTNKSLLEARRSSLLNPELQLGYFDRASIKKVYTMVLGKIVVSGVRSFEW